MRLGFLDLGPAGTGPGSQVALDYLPLAEAMPQVFPHEDHRAFDQITIGSVAKGGHLHPPFRGLTPLPKAPGARLGGSKNAIRTIN